MANPAAAPWETSQDRAERRRVAGGQRNLRTMVNRLPANLYVVADAQGDAKPRNLACGRRRVRVFTMINASQVCAHAQSNLQPPNKRSA